MIRMNVEALTRNQPFCAGVVVYSADGILLTLNPDGMPKDLEDSTWSVGGVGGGQEPEETIWQCALREAREELSVEVELIHSKSTFFHDLDTGTVYPIHVEDEIAPVLFERMTNPTPDKPYRPGLPTGPFIYFASFIAKVPNIDSIQPGDDVQGLMWQPPGKWDEMKRGNTLEELIDQGVKVICRPGMDIKRKLWVHEHESFAILSRLISDNPSLVRY